MKELDEEKAKQAVDEYINAQFDPRASHLWQIIEAHLKPTPPSDQETKP
jgi:hypothetical protein